MYLEVKEKFRKRENYTLSLRYTTTLQKLPRGFYLSSYTAPDGVPRFLATTNFEPTYARSAFPCFDEPHLKARFKISIFRDRFHIALCNMPVLNTEDTGFYMGTGLVSFSRKSISTLPPFCPNPFNKEYSLNSVSINNFIIIASRCFSRICGNEYIFSRLCGMRLFICNQ